MEACRPLVGPPWESRGASTAFKLPLTRLITAADTQKSATEETICKRYSIRFSYIDTACHKPFTILTQELQGASSENDSSSTEKNV